MPCLFCHNMNQLTDEHIFPAFMGGTLVVRDGSCSGCNRDFSVEEAEITKHTLPLLNLLQIKNRYGKVPNASVEARIRGLDIETVPAHVDGTGKLVLKDVVKRGTGLDGKRIDEGFFLTREAGDRFRERGQAKGGLVVEREVPSEVIVDTNYTLHTEFIESIAIRKLAAKIALTSLAFQYGLEFALSEQFDLLRNVRKITVIADLPVRLFANKYLMNASLKSPHQHSVVSYLSAGFKKGWSIVTLFGGITYLVVLTEGYSGRESKQFSVFYDAEVKAQFNPILLADEMTLIGDVLSTTTIFEQPSALLAQWVPMFTDFCEQKGFVVEPVQF